MLSKFGLVLVRFVSVCIAEVVTNWKSLLYIKDNSILKSVIISDSLFALLAICSRKLGINSRSFEAFGLSIKLVWIPSYTNIEFNDEGDKLLKNSGVSHTSLILKFDPKEHWPGFSGEIWRSLEI